LSIKTKRKSFTHTFGRQFRSVGYKRVYSVDTKVGMYIQRVNTQRYKTIDSYIARHIARLLSYITEIQQTIKQQFKSYIVPIRVRNIE